MIRAASLSLVLALGLAQPAFAQLPWLRNYYLNVGLWSDATGGTPAGLADFQRLRFMVEPTLGPLGAAIAYEHLFTYTQQTAAGIAAGLATGVAPGGGTWVDLQWDIATEDHVTWRHRFDRINLGLALGSVADVTLGRQTISWATTLILTPADPFVPFDPADPFREYRAGVDAARVQLFPDPLSDLDLILRPSDTAGGVTITAAGRWRGVIQTWEYSLWAGVLHDKPAVGLGVTGGLGSVAVRAEAEFRERDDGAFVVRTAGGIDTRVTLADRDLYVIAEYQHDGLGAANSRDLATLLRSPAFARGELQVVGANVFALQGSYHVHPLVGLSLLTLLNGNDPSALLSPGVSVSVSDEASARAGLFMGVGSDGILEDGVPTSEFGLVPTIFFASLSVFF